MKLFHRKDFLGTAARALRATLVLLVVMQFLEYRGLLAGPEGTVLDSLLRAGSAELSRKPPVITVEIDDAAYQKCFDASSPLDPNGVFGLVKGVHSAGPAVIGVDIVTDADKHNPTYRKLAGESHELQASTIWIAGAAAAKFDLVSFPGWMIGHEEHLIVNPSRILGYEAEEADHHGIRWGVPVFPKDADLNLRRFPREIMLSADPNSAAHAEEKAGWAKIIAERYCETRGDCRILDRKVREIFVPYSQGPERRINALDLFTCSGQGRVAAGGRLWAEFQDNAKDKIVMIGGTFGSARDSYETPIGRIPGLLVNAYAVQSEINGTGIQERHLAAVVFDVVVGIGIACIAWALRRRGMRAMMTASMGLLLAALLITYWQFGRGYVLSFTGLVVGLFLHQMYEVWHMNPKAAGH